MQGQQFYAAPYPQPKKSSNNIILLSVFGGLLLIGVVVIMLIGLKVFDFTPAKSAVKSTVENTPLPVLSAKPSPSAAPTPTRTPMPTKKPANTPVATASPVHSSGITKEDMLAYFLEVAVLQPEGFLLRWEAPIKVEIKGNYTDEDYERIVSQLDMFNDIGTLPPITVVKKGGNFTIHLVPMAQMNQIFPDYKDGYRSYYNYYWNDDYQLNKFVTSVASDETSQEQRNYLLLEMIARGMGIFNGSTKYQDSIFQSEWTDLQSLSDLDYMVIGMLYCPAIKPGILKTNTEVQLKEWLGSIE